MERDRMVLEEEKALFEIIYKGNSETGMPAFASLGADKVWQVVNFVKYYKTGEVHH